MEIYVVKSGDTLFRIARAYGTTVEQLFYVNQLERPGVLSVGQALIIPREIRIHRVQPGESLYTIARQYQVSLTSLIRANPQLTNPGQIQPGQKLSLPGDNGDGRRITVNGYATDVTRAVLEESLPHLSLFSLFAYRAEADGSLVKTFQADIGLSQNYGVKNLLTVTNQKPSGGFSGDIAHALFTDEAAQGQLLEQIDTLLARDGYGGVNLDLEYVFPGDREAYNRFLEVLSERLHRQGYLLVSALAPKVSADQPGLLYEAHDYPAHGRFSDFTVLMTYEWGYTYGPPMAVAPVNMVRRVLDYAVTAIPPEKILMGIPNYGYDWTLPFTQGSAARALSNVRAVTLAGEVGAEIQYDTTAQAPFFRYRTADGTRHEVWFEDARSIQAKMDLPDAYGLGGISYWNLNRLFRTLFYVQESVNQVKR